MDTPDGLWSGWLWLLPLGGMLVLGFMVVMIRRLFRAHAREAAEKPTAGDPRKPNP